MRLDSRNFLGRGRIVAHPVSGNKLYVYGSPPAVQRAAFGVECEHHGVRVCTDYIKLPKSLPAFPNGGGDPPFGCRWMEKNSFISVLDELGEKKK